MPKITVVDTSTLILFDKLGMLMLLEKLFGKIHITSTVAKEFNKPLPGWVEVHNPNTDLPQELTTSLDIGEASIISLASGYTDCLLIIDELKGRSIARKLGIRLTGALGILITAKKKKIIPEVRPILEQIQATNFRISESLVKTVLRSAGEL